MPAAALQHSTPGAGDTPQLEGNCTLSGLLLCLWADLQLLSSPWDATVYFYPSCHLTALWNNAYNTATKISFSIHNPESIVSALENWLISTQFPTLCVYNKFLRGQTFRILAASQSQISRIKTIWFFIVFTFSVINVKEVLDKSLWPLQVCPPVFDQFSCDSKLHGFAKIDIKCEVNRYLV